MATQIKERPKLAGKIRNIDNEATRDFAVSNAPDVDTAVSQVRQMIAAENDQYTVNGVTLNYDYMQFVEFGGGCYNFTARYVDAVRKEFNFDIGSTNSKMVQALEDIRYYNFQNPADTFGATVPDLGGGINYDGGHFQGTDVENPKVEFSVNKKVKFALLDPEYLASVFRISQTVNDADFTFDWMGQQLVFIKGTLRFRGLRLKQDAETLDCTYNFAYSRSLRPEDDVTINGVVIVKEGWQYLSVLYDNVESNGFMVKQPIAGYVYRVYDYADLTILDL